MVNPKFEMAEIFPVIIQILFNAVYHHDLTYKI